MVCATCLTLLLLCGPKLVDTITKNNFVAAFCDHDCLPCWVLKLFMEE